MAFQTEVTLQPDRMCCLRVMGKQSRIAEIVILSPSVPDGPSLRTYPKVSCVVSEWLTRDSVNVDVVILPSLYVQTCHHAMYMNNYHHLCISFMHM